MSEDDSQHAPTLSSVLSSVEPISSIESNVLSVEMPPPTLSPNYGSPNHQDLSEEEAMETVKTAEEEEDHMEEEEENDDEEEENDDEEEEDEKDEEEETVEETSQHHQPSSQSDQLEQPEPSLSGGSSDLSQDFQREIDLDDPPGQGPVSSLTSIQLPRVPLSLHDTKLFTTAQAEQIKTLSPTKETVVS